MQDLKHRAEEVEIGTDINSTEISLTTLYRFNMVKIKENVKHCKNPFELLH